MIEKPKRGPGRPPKVERKSKQMSRDRHLLFFGLWHDFQVANNQGNLTRQDELAGQMMDILDEARGR